MLNVSLILINNLESGMLASLFYETYDNFNKSNVHHFENK